MTREAQLMTGEKTVYCGHALLDTGANHGSYIGEAMVAELPDLLREPCVHSVKLGDGATQVHLTEFVTIDVALYDDDGRLCDSIATEFYIMPKLGKQIIIGLPDLLGNFYDYFTSVLERARLRKPAVRLERLQQLYGLCRELLCTPPESDQVSQIRPLQSDPSNSLESDRISQIRPDQSDPIGSSRFGPKSAVSNRSLSDQTASTQKQLKIYSEEARHIGSWYSRHKHRVLSDIRHTETFTTSSDGTTRSMVSSPTHGTAYMDDSVEQLCQIVQELKDFPIGQIIEAWSNPAEECPEEMDTPDPLAFGEEILHYMEMTNDEAREEYHSLLEEHISPEMRKAVPRVIDIMTSSAALETFAPSAWNGLKIKPIEFDIIPGMPTSMPVKARNLTSMPMPRRSSTAWPYTSTSPIVRCVPHQ